MITSMKSSIYAVGLLLLGSMITVGCGGGGATQANALNNFAHVVGYSVSMSDGSAHATLWHDGSAIDIGGPNTFANGINDSDKIVGYRSDSSFVAHAHLWPEDIDLGSLPGFDSSIATGI